MKRLIQAAPDPMLLNRTIRNGMAWLILLVTAGQATQAQSDRTGTYFPLDHRIPGRVSRWAQTIHPPCEAYLQPVRIELPSRGLVTFFDGGPENPVLTQAPSQAAMLVGQTYRVRISGMPEFPGVELFPSIEIIDRLHPPAGRADEFPIPIQLTEEDIATALDDQLVTRVVYLEQPQLADPQPVDRPLKVVDLPASANLLQAADERGRPMAIVRLGGRVPDLNDPGDRRFFGTTAPILPRAIVPKNEPEPVTQRSVTFGPLAAE